MIQLDASMAYVAQKRIPRRFVGGVTAPDDIVVPDRNGVLRKVANKGDALPNELALEIGLIKELPKAAAPVEVQEIEGATYVDAPTRSASIERDNLLKQDWDRARGTEQRAGVTSQSFVGRSEDPKPAAVQTADDDPKGKEPEGGGKLKDDGKKPETK